jgi:uncharacterized damage-inducible protein DinB
VNIEDVRDLFAYDEWANRRIVAGAAELSPEEFTRDLRASFGSVRGTLVHIMWGEKRWLQWWVDGSTLPDPSPNDFLDCPSLLATWSQVVDTRRAFVGELTADRLQSALVVRGQSYTMAELIKHVTNHSTYHRGQVVLLLRLLGRTPQPTDYRLFLSESRESAA